jgi:integron integrase
MNAALHQKIREKLGRLTEIIRRKGLAIATEDNYSQWCRRFMVWLVEHRERLKDLPSEGKVEQFLSYLAKERDVAASTQNQAFHALRFYYAEVEKKPLENVDALRAKRPVHVRHAPSRETVKSLLEVVQDRGGYPTRLITWLLYACGLRVSEPLNLRVRDIDLQRASMVIRGAKGGKDRMISIPDSLLPLLERQLRAARLMWEKAREQGVPVKLPNQLGKKYPQAATSWAWFFLFPSDHACVDPRSGKRVWWRCHEANVQRAVAEAAKKIGQAGSVSPHHLRHAWATHAMDGGAHVRDIQACLGHKSLETTMIYLTPETNRVLSPIESLKLTA